MDRQRATACRKRMHEAVANEDIEALRAAIDELFDRSGPLGDQVGTPEAFAPLVEVAFTATLHLGADHPITEEMRLNVRHCYRQFGLSEDDYAVIRGQLDERAQAGWGAGTYLEGCIRPWRHQSLFG